MTRTALRRALAVLVCALLLLPVVTAAPAGATQGRSPTTTPIQKGDRPTNYVGFGAIALGLTVWAVVFAVVLYRSPRRASMLRRRAP